MIIIADVHLGRANDSVMIDGVLSQTRDIRSRLRTVLARAKLTNQCIAIAGDIFNRVNPTTQVITEMFDWFVSCKVSGVKVYIIPGNHDAGVDWTSMKMFEGADLSNVTVIISPGEVVVSEGKGLNEVSRAILFWPHIPANEREKAEQGHGNVSRWVASIYPKAEFIITHGTITEGYENDIFFEAGESMKIDPGEFSELKLMVAGHIHEHTEGPNWVFPGSLIINNFGEVDEKKGWVEVDLINLVRDWYEFPDDVTPWVHVELDLTEKDETVIDEKKIEELVSGAVIKITVFAKTHGVVNEVYIKQLFNRYGYVTRFETVVADSITEIVQGKTRLSYEELLSEYLDNNTDATDEEKTLAVKMGTKIIEESRV
jgi:DNA repair exonuclease SbcCD nuclease subunit